MKPHAHESHSEIINRLRRAKGHLKKVIAMLEAGEDCLRTAQQLHGVSNAIVNAKAALIHDHIEHCLDATLHLEDEKHQRATLQEFKEITKYL